MVMIDARSGSMDAVKECVNDWFAYVNRDIKDTDFSTDVTMASSVQGILIPPSHNMVIYATVAGTVSIGRLFLAGFGPGIVLGVALMIYS